MSQQAAAITRLYRGQVLEVLTDIFTRNILRHSCFMFKYSMTDSNQPHKQN